MSFDDVFRETSARYGTVEPSSGSDVIPRPARPGLAGLRPHTFRRYAPGEILGHSLEKLHGPATDPRTVMRINQALANQESVPPALF